MNISIYNQENYERLKENKNKCLCTVDEVDCMCEQFKNSEHGVCHCEVYEKVEYVIFKTETCPKCQVLSKKLDESGIKYKESYDLDEISEAGFRSVPVLKVNGEYMDFSNAIKFINKRRT